MKLCVLALDYDGTTAINDKMDSGIRRVIADARSRRIAVVLVTGRRLRRIHLALRITHHIRHREKYVAVPVPDPHAFVFTHRNMPNVRASTLKEFVVALDAFAAEGMEAHARRGDFSRWWREVLGDYPLALAVHTLEERCRNERDPPAVPAIASAIRGRYDLTSDEAIPCAEEAR